MPRKRVSPAFSSTMAFLSLLNFMDDREPEEPRKTFKEALGAWVKRHICDDCPEGHEDHAWVRYGAEAAPSSPQDYIDWSKVPVAGNYVAMDKDGRVSWYRDRAPSMSDNGYWYTNDGEMWTKDQWLDEKAIIGPLPPWRESLRQRPLGGKPTRQEPQA